MALVTLLLMQERETHVTPDDGNEAQQPVQMAIVRLPAEGQAA